MVNKKSQSGFTLIELIVSLGVFSVVITIAVGALLMLVATNEQLQGEQSVMTNLSFALDSMTREIRTGSDYYCDEANNYDAGGPNNIFDGYDGNNLDSIIGSDGYRNCAGRTNANRTLHGVAFVEGGDSISGGNERILFFHDSNTGQLYRRIGTEEPISITGSGLYINNAEFYVTGSRPVADGPPNHDDQASVTIIIEASAASTSPADEIVTVQTTVSQRTLDI